MPHLHRLTRQFTLRLLIAGGCLAGLTARVQAQSTQPQPEAALPNPMANEAPTLRFEHLGLEDGLAQGSANTIMQDSQGFLWIATQGGLHRYDGHAFTVYANVPFDTTSLSESWVWSTTEAKNGDLWVATDNGGLNRMDRATGRFTHYRHDPDDSTSLSSDRLFHTLEDRRGDLWIGTFSDGLNRMPAGQDGRFTRYRHDPQDPGSLSHDVLFWMSEDADGHIWVGSANGVNRIDPETEAITRFLYDPESTRGYGASQNVLGQYLPPEEPGILWLATGNGLVRLDSRTGTHERFLIAPNEDPNRTNPLNFIHQVVPDPSDPAVLWVAGPGTGVARFDRRTGQFDAYRHDERDPNSLRQDLAVSLLADRSGTLWVGYQTEGLSAFNPGAVNFAHLRHDPEDVQSLAPGIVWGIYEDREGTLWVGTDTGAGGNYLTQFDAATGRVTRHRHDPNDPATLQPGAFRVFAEDAEEQFWVGASGGLARLDRSTGRVTRFLHDVSTLEGRRRNSIFALLPAGPDARMLWVGSIGGLDRFDARTGQFTPFPMDLDGLQNDPVVLSLHEDADGILWAGTSDGLVRVDPAGEATLASAYDPRDTTSISSNTIIAVMEREREPGILWLVTFGGLNRFDTKTGTVRHFMEADGLPSNTVYGILEDEAGTLWMSTNGGISNFDPDTETFRNYGLDDGLIALEYNQHAFAKGAGGVLYFGSGKGVTAFAPGRLHTNEIPPQVALSGLRLFNEPVAVGPDSPLTKPLAETETITLSHDQNEVAFDFVALHFANAAKNRYAYRLEGYDRDWIEAGGQRTASYTNLPPGRYTFRVKAANADGVWNEEGASVGLRILPPWWRTWWAYGLFGLVFAGGVFAVDRLQRHRLLKKERERTRQLEERSRELEQVVEARTGEIQERVEELAVINSVQDGLVRELDMQAIYDLVGDRLRELFDAQVVALVSFDHKAETEQFHYLYENGERFRPAPRPLDWLRRKLIETRELILINENLTETFVTLGEAVEPVPGTVWPKSVLFVPLIIGGQVMGYVSLQNLDREHAFSDSDVRLLSTLTNSMSIALENARLFAETRQQATELNTVNQISRALVAQLDFDALVHLVGEQMRETFDADIVYVALHDREADMLRFPYEHGDKNPPRPFGSGLTEKIITKREPLLINRDMAEVRKQLQAQQIGKVAASYLGVPIPVGEEAIGVISVQSTKEENRFDADDLRLLNTIAANVGVALQNAEAYRKLNVALDHLKRTQQQLVQSEKMASLGALTAGIAHEIKNPLNFVNNFAAVSRELVEELIEELEAETDPDEIRAILSDLKTNATKIEEHGRRADGIVRSMMQHARGGTGQREPVALNAFIDEYVDLAWHGKRATAPDFNVEIVRDYGEGIGSLEVVPQDLGRVLINLLSNAFDAVSEQKAKLDGQYAPQVRIATRRMGDAVEIRVADNGGGIPEEVKARIFEPFFTTKPTGSGTGLGLSMSYDIVTQGHGGTLTVENAPGEGAAFVVTLPMAATINETTPAPERLN